MKEDYRDYLLGSARPAPNLDAMRADLATLKPRAQVSILTDAQERLLYEAVPALLAEIERLRIENAALNVALDLADAAARDLGY